MANIAKLYIKVKLNGDITGTIDEYNYMINSDPKSKYKSIYLTKQYILKKQIINDSKYRNKEKLIFLEPDALRQIIAKVKKSKTETEKSPGDIIKDNINLILSILFPPNSNFYVKGKRFIIKKTEVPNIDSYDNAKLQNYNALEDELFDKEQASELIKLKTLKARFTKFLGKLDNDTTKSDFIKKYPIIDADNDKLKTTAATNVIKRLSTNKGILEVNDYGKKKVKLLNLKAAKKGSNILYKYVNNKGIQYTEDKSLGVHCTITLYLLDAKHPMLSQLRHNCKTTKKNISKLYKQITRKTSFKKPESESESEEEEEEEEEEPKPKYTVDTLVHPLFSNDGDVAHGHKIVSGNITRKKSINQRGINQRGINQRGINQRGINQRKKGITSVENDDDDDDDDDDDIDIQKQINIWRKRHKSNLQKRI